LEAYQKRVCEDENNGLKDDHTRRDAENVKKWEDAFASGDSKYGKYSENGTLQERLKNENYDKEDGDGGFAFLSCLQDAFAGVKQVIDKDRELDSANYTFYDNNGYGYGQQDRWIFVETDEIPIDRIQHGYFQYQISIAFALDSNVGPWEFARLVDGIPVESLNDDGGLEVSVEITRRSDQTDRGYYPTEIPLISGVLHPETLFADIAKIESEIEDAITEDFNRFQFRRRKKII
jgi:hypothetical protein